MKIQDSTLTVAPNTPALKPRETLGSGLKDRTCKLNVILRLILMFLFPILTKGWLLLPRREGVSDW